MDGLSIIPWLAKCNVFKNKGVNLELRAVRRRELGRPGDTQGGLAGSWYLLGLRRIARSLLRREGQGRGHVSLLEWEAWLRWWGTRGLEPDWKGQSLVALP